MNTDNVKSFDVLFAIDIRFNKYPILAQSTFANHLCDMWYVLFLTQASCNHLSHACTYTVTHTHKYKYTLSYTMTYPQAYTHTGTSVIIRTHMQVHIYTRTHMYICNVYTLVGTQTHIHTRTNTHMHTYTCTHARTHTYMHAYTHT